MDILWRRRSRVSKAKHLKGCIKKLPVSSLVGGWGGGGVEGSRVGWWGEGFRCQTTERLPLKKYENFLENKCKNRCEHTNNDFEVYSSQVP